MCGDYNLRREKRYVEVDVRFTPDGKIRPLAINYDKTRTYGIDRVLAVRHGTSRLGGKGHCIMDKCDFFLRYTGLDKFGADVLIQ